MAAEPFSLSGSGAAEPTLALLALAGCATLYFVFKLQPHDAGAFAFVTAWLLAPYVALAALLATLRRRGKYLLAWCIAAVLVTIAGLAVLVDAIYLQRDAQSAIAVVVAPLLQLVVFLVAAPLAWWVGRHAPAQAGRGWRDR